MEKALSADMIELREAIVGKVLVLTSEIEYAKGAKKKLLIAKYEGYKEVWELTGGDIPDLYETK